MIQTAIVSGVSVASLVIKKGAGSMLSLSGYNTGLVDQFLLLFDADSLPDEGAVPIACVRADQGCNFSFDIPVAGLPFSNGMVACNSLSSTVKQIGAADCIFTAVILA